MLQIPHVKEMAQYFSFSAGLISRRAMSCRFVQAVTNDRTSSWKDPWGWLPLCTHGGDPAPGTPPPSYYWDHWWGEENRTQSVPWGLRAPATGVPIGPWWWQLWETHIWGVYFTHLPESRLSILEQWWHFLFTLISPTGRFANLTPKFLPGLIAISWLHTWRAGTQPVRQASGNTQRLSQPWAQEPGGKGGPRLWPLEIQSTYCGGLSTSQDGASALWKLIWCAFVKRTKASSIGSDIYTWLTRQSVCVIIVILLPFLFLISLRVLIHCIRNWEEVIQIQKPLTGTVSVYASYFKLQESQNARVWQLMKWV